MNGAILTLMALSLLQAIYILFLRFDKKAEESRSAILDDENNDLLKTVKNYEEAEVRYMARIKQLEISVMNYYRSQGIETQEFTEVDSSDWPNNYGSQVPPLIALTKITKMVH